MGHLPLDQLNDQIESAKLHVTVGAKYVHYKNLAKPYTIIDLVIIEATDEVGVVYRADHDARFSFVRSLKEWLDHVEYNGKTVPRFTPVSA
ncbi:MAG TPA: DUF1653 domain-containing protein [Candidatus Saccharimonadales bacterium]|nr:DUF1653 domain-containing protein [Candidatus Saccharimonadales bacterium]